MSEEKEGAPLQEEALQEWGQMHSKGKEVQVRPETSGDARCSDSLCVCSV